MDKDVLGNFLKMLNSDNDSDALMALRALQQNFAKEGAELSDLIAYGVNHIQDVKKAATTFEKATTAAPASKPKQAITVSGMPQCWSPQAGSLEIIPSGEDKGEVVALPGPAAAQSEEIAMNLKDALVAAAINKSKLKLKLLDVKNNKGEILETILQAEYDRDGMTPVRIWTNARGEVAALAAVLRKAVANAWPELAA